MSEGGFLFPDAGAGSGTEEYYEDLQSDQYLFNNPTATNATTAGPEVLDTLGIADNSSITVSTSRQTFSQLQETIENKITQQLQQGQIREGQHLDHFPIEPQLPLPFSAAAEHGLLGDIADAPYGSGLASHEGNNLNWAFEEIPLGDLSQPSNNRTQDTHPTAFFPAFERLQSPIPTEYVYLSKRAREQFHIPEGHELGPSSEAWMSGSLSRESFIFPIELLDETVQTTLDVDMTDTGRWSINHALAVKDSGNAGQQLQGWKAARDLVDLNSNTSGDMETGFEKKKLSADLRLTLPGSIPPSMDEVISDNRTIAGRRVQAGFQGDRQHQEQVKDGCFSIFKPTDVPEPSITVAPSTEGAQPNLNPQPENSAADAVAVEPPKKRGRGRPRKDPSQLAKSRKKNKKTPSTGTSSGEKMTTAKEQIPSGNGQRPPDSQAPASSGALAPDTQIGDKNQGRVASSAGTPGAAQMMPGSGQQLSGAQLPVHSGNLVPPIQNHASMTGVEHTMRPGNGHQPSGAQLPVGSGGYVSPAQIRNSSRTTSTSMAGNQQHLGAQELASGRDTPAADAAAATPKAFANLKAPFKTTEYTSVTTINLEYTAPSLAQPREESHFDDAMWHVEYQKDLDDRYEARTHNRSAAARVTSGGDNVVDLTGCTAGSTDNQQQGSASDGLSGNQQGIADRAGNATGHSDMSTTGSRKICGPSINEVLAPSLHSGPGAHNTRWANRKGPAATATPATRAVNPKEVLKPVVCPDGKAGTRAPTMTVPARRMPAVRPDLSITTEKGQREEADAEKEEDPHARFGGCTRITDHMDFSKDPDLEHLAIFYDTRYD